MRNIQRARTASGNPYHGSGSGDGNHMSSMKGSMRGPSMKVASNSMRAADEGYGRASTVKANSGRPVAEALVITAATIPLDHVAHTAVHVANNKKIPDNKVVPH